MKYIRVLSFFLSVVLLLSFASCAVPEENVMLASPVAEITATPMLTPTATPLAQKPARTPMRTLAPTPSPTPSLWPSYEWNPDKPFAALRAFMDAEIAAVLNVGPAPFEADMLNAIARDLWYSGRFSFFASVQGRSVDYVAYAMTYSKEDYKVVMITDNEDSGLLVNLTVDDRNLNGMRHLYVYDEPDHEQSIATLQESNLERLGPFFPWATASPTRAPGEQVAYINTVTVPEAARGQEEPIVRPEMSEAVFDAVFAFILEEYEAKPGRYSVVAGDYSTGISSRVGYEGCLSANFEMYIRGTTAEGKRWRSYEHVNYRQKVPGDSAEGEISLQGINPNYSTVYRAAPTLTHPETDEEWAWHDEEIWRRLDEYHDYQWQRLLDQGLYAKEITVE